MTQIAFVLLTSRYCKDDLKMCLIAINNELKSIFASNEEWKPTFTIDDGKTEKSALKDRCFKFVLCKFHLVRAWTKYMDSKLDLSEELYTKILGHLYKLYACRTKDEYKKRYHDLQEFAPDEFMEYYNREWHNEDFYKRWTCIKRESTFSDWATNNITEAMFKNYKITGKNHSRMSNFVHSLIQFLKVEPYSVRLDRYPTDTEKEAKRRFKKSVGIQVKKKGSGDTYLYEVQSQTDKSLQWSCNLFDMSCNCIDFYYNCRPCKHLYACMRDFLKEKKHTIPVEDCFLFINSVFYLIHEPENFDSWNIELRRAYPPTFKKPGRPPVKKETEKKKKKQRNQPDIEYEIDSVEGVQIQDGSSLKILVEWTEGKQCSWTDFDENSNFECTKQFFLDLATYSKKKKGTGRKEFDRVERKSGAKKPYSFFDGSKEVPFPSYSIIVKYAREFNIHLD
jgi:hypothetical protein